MKKKKDFMPERELKKQIRILRFFCFTVISFTNLGMLILLDPFLSVAHLPSLFIRISIIYAILIASLVTYIIYFAIDKYFIRPLKELDFAASRVSRGDFSVYVEPVNSANHYTPVDTLIENFNTMVDDLSTLETMKTDFISNVSHEIRTPLGNIKNYAYALKDPNLPAEKRIEYADTIIEASEKLNTMVTNILKLNKLENQTVQTVIEEYDLCEQLGECILSFEKLWSEKNIEIAFDTEDRAMIRSDRDMLSIVWTNILSNAFKFTENGGKVGIRQRTEGDFVVISILDTGCGMSEETKRRMFDKFYQGDTSHSGEGNGLGLALVWRILQLMQGELNVESELNKGTVFTVKLPRNEKDV